MNRAVIQSRIDLFKKLSCEEEKVSTTVIAKVYGV